MSIYTLYTSYMPCYLSPDMLVGVLEYGKASYFSVVESFNLHSERIKIGVSKHNYEFQANNQCVHLIHMRHIKLSTNVLVSFKLSIVQRQSSKYPIVGHASLADCPDKYM